MHGRARRAAPGLITLLAQESPGIRENPLPGILLRTVLGNPPRKAQRRRNPVSVTPHHHTPSVSIIKPYGDLPEKKKKKACCRRRADAYGIPGRIVGRWATPAQIVACMEAV